VDADRFDAMVQMASGRGSRRGILAALAGGLLALLAPAAEAKRDKKPKRPAKRRHGGRPHARTAPTAAAGNVCPPAQM
jgi:hypothetical protein